ncbi:hypothetical protein MMC25_007864 [Agyrium rufum]|nr:hypothetical protein [Agyrium rufum]
MAGQKLVKVAIMGVTGAGKSSFIRTITQRDDIVIGKGLQSETVDAASYLFSCEGINYALIDTPGFNDTKRSDQEVLAAIMKYLSEEYEMGQLLSGIIYLHPISCPRVQGSMMNQIRVLKELCGSEAFDNVLLGTTFWEEVELAKAEAREEELFSTDCFLGDMKDFGAKPTRVYQDREHCIELIQSFAVKERKALKIQRDLAKPGARLESTSAAEILSGELIALQLEQDRELDLIREEADRAEEERIRVVREREARLQREQEEVLRQRQQERERLRLQQQRDEARRRERDRQAEQSAAKERERQTQVRREMEQRTREAARLAAETKRREEQLKKEKEEVERVERRRRAEDERKRRAQQAEIERHRLTLHSRESLIRRGYGLVCLALNQVMDHRL